MISVVVADDQELVREGLAAILAAQDDIAVVGTAADGAEAVGLVHATDPDVALMDIRMPGLDGIEATRRLVEAGCRTRMLILTTFETDDYVMRALRVGASGFLLKDAPTASLLAAVRAVSAGDVALEDSVLKRLVHESVVIPVAAPPRNLDRLTARELEVLALLGQGHSNAEIARTLSVSTTTVKTHVARAQAKLGARDRIQLVVMAHTARLAP